METDPRHVAALRSNLEKVGATDRADVVRADAYRWAANYSGEGFTLAFADPPYALGEERGYASVLATLASGALFGAFGAPAFWAMAAMSLAALPLVPGLRDG